VGAIVGLGCLDLETLEPRQEKFKCDFVPPKVPSSVSKLDGNKKKSDPSDSVEFYKI
jgi:hypothetical protein